MTKPPVSKLSPPTVRTGGVVPDAPRRQQRLGARRPKVPPEPADPVSSDHLRHELEVQNEQLRLTQTALETSRDGYVDLFDNAPLAYVTLGASGAIVEANREATLLLGSPRSELWNQPLSEYVSPDERPRLARHWSMLIRGEGPQSLEVRLKPRNGEAPSVALQMRLVRPERGSVQCRVAMFDISERVRMQEGLERLAAIVSSSDDAIVGKTLDGVITSWNPGAQRLFGYDASEAIGQPITILIPPELQAEEPLILERLRRGERIDHYETVRLRKDGSRFHVSLSVSPIRDAASKIIGAAKIARDITLHKAIERQTKEHANLLQLLSSTSAAISGNLDLREVVQTVTDTGTRLSEAEFGAFFYNVVDDQGEAYQLYTLSGAPRAAFEKLGLPRNVPVFAPGEGVVRSDDITADSRYGQMAPHHGMPPGHLPVRSYLAVPVVARTGSVLGGLFFGHSQVGVFTQRTEQLVRGLASQAAIAIQNAHLYAAAQREIAARQKAEAALREMDRRKDEFLATLAHELRNPLAPIRQAAVVSAATAATEDQRRWSHDVIARQVQNMSTLLEDLLDVSRITRGSLQLRTQSTDLKALVDAAIEAVRPAIESKRHQLLVDLPAIPVRLLADPLRLSQVLSNFLSNAAKYTDAEGQIHIACTVEGEQLVIRVRDNGIGIPPESLSAVFEMFSQVRSEQDRSEGGLGIGLALSKGIVELHGGSIEARSDGPGKGSEFIVRIPLRTAPPPQDQQPAAGAPTAVPKRVLIADDNRDNADSLCLVLRLEGHDVAVVYDGAAAIEAFEASRPDVMLLDIGMPKVDGYAVATSIKARTQRGRAPTLVAITGWGQDSDKAKVLAAGFDHHLTKPIEPSQVLKLINSSDSES